MADGGSIVHRVFIPTALSLEYEAVRDYLTDIQEIVHLGTVYEQGKFIDGTQTWEVLLVEMGKGNTNAAIEVERAIQFFNPALLLFVGIGGGLKDVQAGDVVAATKVYGYEFGKAEADTFKTRPELGNSAYNLIQRARAVSRAKKWQQRIADSPERRPEAFIGPIAAGEKVITSRLSSTAQVLQDHYGDALAVDMEGFGVLAAVHIHTSVEALIIRGISDMLDDKKNPGNDEFQKVAARHAAAFAFEILAKLYATNAQQNTPNVAVNSAPSSDVAGSQASTFSRENRAIRIYYSYADTEKDTRMVEELKKHLAILRFNKQISEWDHSKVKWRGSGIEQEIKNHLNDAQIILLCVSPDYTTSETTLALEMPIAMDLMQKQVTVIPILLRPMNDLIDLPFGHIQRLPRNNRAISEQKEGVFAEVAKEISDIIKAKRNAGA